MRFKGLLAATAALAMVAAPATAASNPAAGLSVAHSVRAHAATTRNSDFVFTTEIFAVVIGLAIIAGAVLVISDDDNAASR